MMKKIIIMELLNTTQHTYLQQQKTIKYYYNINKENKIILYVLRSGVNPYQTPSTVQIKSSPREGQK